MHIPCFVYFHRITVILWFNHFVSYNMNSHYDKGWVTLLSCGLNSCQSIDTQKVMNNVQRERGGWVYFLYFHKPLDTTSVLPLIVHVCRSLEVGRIVSSCLQKLIMLFFSDHSAVLCLSLRELWTPFTLTLVILNHASKHRTLGSHYLNAYMVTFLV